VFNIIFITNDIFNDRNQTDDLT